MNELRKKINDSVDMKNAKKSVSSLVNIFNKMDTAFSQLKSYMKRLSQNGNSLSEDELSDLLVDINTKAEKLNAFLSVSFIHEIKRAIK